MAKMSFREPNQVLWYGSRPAHRGAQIAKDAQASDSTVICHTVSAGKTFFLTKFIFSSGWGAGLGTLVVRNASDVPQYTIASLQFSSAAGAPGVTPGFFNPPLEIPAGWDLAVISSAAGHIANVFIHGWEE